MKTPGAGFVSAGAPTSSSSGSRVAQWTPCSSVAKAPESQGPGRLGEASLERSGGGSSAGTGAGSWRWRALKASTSVGAVFVTTSPETDAPACSSMSTARRNGSLSTASYSSATMTLSVIEARSRVSLWSGKAGASSTTRSARCRRASSKPGSWSARKSRSGARGSTPLVMTRKGWPMGPTVALLSSAEGKPPSSERSASANPLSLGRLSRRWIAGVWRLASTSNTETPSPARPAAR